MTDARLRQLQRAHKSDPTEASEEALLHERLRIGEECRTCEECEGGWAFWNGSEYERKIGPCPTCGGQNLAQRIQLAAYLQHSAALRVCGYGVDWTQCEVCGAMVGPEVFLHDCQKPALTWVRHLATFGQVVAVRVALTACEVAQKALIDDVPEPIDPLATRCVFDAARAWVECPCPEHHAECANLTNSLSHALIPIGATGVGASAEGNASEWLEAGDSYVTDAWIAFGFGVLTGPAGASDSIARNQIPACVRLGATEPAIRAALRQTLVPWALA